MTLYSRASSVSPWERYLQGQEAQPTVTAAVSPIQQRMDGGAASPLSPAQQQLQSAGSGGSLALPSSGSFGEDSEQYEQARDRYDRQRAISAALGEDGDLAESDGMLSTALQYLDRPSAVVRGALSGLAGWDHAESDIDGVLPRIGAALSGEERFGAGEFGSLVMQDDDSLLQRALRGGAAFAGEVVTDPLVYVSGGGSVLGKRGAARFIQNRASDWTPQLGGQQRRALAARHLSSETDRAAIRQANELQRAGDAAQARQLRRGAMERRREQPQRSIDDLATETLQAEAAESYFRGGPRELRRYLHEQAGSDMGELLFNQLPRDIQGGIRIRVPFMERTADGVRFRAPMTEQHGTPWAFGVGGGGRLTAGGFNRTTGQFDDPLKVGILSQRLHRGRNALRGSEPVRGVLDRVSGRHGSEYGAFIRGLAQESDDAGRMTYQRYMQWSESMDASIRGASRLTATDHEELANAELIASTVARDADELTQIKTQAQDYFMRMGTPDAPSGPLAGNRIDEAAFSYAASLHNAMRRRLGTLQEEGILEPGQQIENFIPRLLTKEARKQLRERTVQPASGVGAGGGYDTSRTRRAFMHFDEESGVISLTPEQANEVARSTGLSQDALFETDMLRVTGSYLAATARQVQQKRLASELVDRRLIEPVGTFTREGVDVPALRQQRESARRLTQQVQAAGDVDEELVANVVADDAHLGRLVERISEAGRVTAEVDRQLTDMVQVLGRLQARGHDAGVADALSTARATTSSPRLDRLGDFMLDERGFRRLGGEGSPTDLRLPTELTPSAAAPSIRKAAERFYRAQSRDSGFLKWVDDVYSPFMALWRTFATVGRGFGYHFRNTIGGLWNGWLSDVGAADYAVSLRVARKMNDVQEQVRREITPSMTSQDLHARTHRLLREQMTDTEYKLLQAAENQGVLRNTRTAESLVQQTPSGDIIDLRGSSRPGEWLRLLRRDPTRRIGREGVDPDFTSLFPRTSPEDLNLTQRAANRLANNWWLRLGSSMAEANERFLRIAALNRGAREFGLGDGGLRASQFVKATQFDYSDLHPWERVAMRQVAIPFWTWTRNAVPLQVRALMYEPGRINRLVRGHDELRRTLESDDPQHQEAADMLPRWIRRREGFVSRFASEDFLPDWEWLNESGIRNDAPINIGIESPTVDLERLLVSDAPFVDPEEVLNSMNPLIKTGAETGLGVSTFTGEAMPDQVTAPAYMSWIPGVTWSGEGDRGRQTDPRLYYGVRGLVPPLAQVERLAGLTPASRERMLTSWLSQAAALPVATTNPRQVAGELRSRADDLVDANSRLAAEAGVTREELADLLAQGIPPEQIRQSLAGR